MSTVSRTAAITHPQQLFIDGEWVDASTGRTFDVLDASTEEVFATVAEAGPDDVDRAVAAARNAFDRGPWPDMPHTERAAILRAIADEFEARADELASIWAAESGVVYALGAPRLGAMVADTFRSYADLGETFPFEEQHATTKGAQGLLVHEPVGVVAAVVPWNGPAALVGYKCAPALIAGCTLVLKMSPEAPCSGYVMAEICEKVGLPPGVVNVITADREVSEQLVSDPRIDKVSFTGSTAAGRKVGAICADRVARCTLELGGKSPALVLDDYDLGAAATSLIGSMTYLTGQVCHNLTRIIVTEPRHDDMVTALAEAANALHVGDAFDESVDMGPLATSMQRDRVEGYIAKGREGGATIAAGGGRPADLDRGYFIEPTVFAGVDNQSVIAQEEIFGPVISVIPARDEQHAIELANDTIYGLNASVFTSDVQHARAVARRLKAGTVGHNGSRTDFGIAFGGFKQSGVGREGGEQGLRLFLESKTVILDEG